MSCKYRISSSDELITCMGLTPIYTDAQVQVYANRGGAGGISGGGNFVTQFVIANLRVNRMIRPNIPEGPCGNLHGVATGTQTAFGVIGTLESKDAEPISHVILAGISAIGSFFSGLFSGAPSAQELQVDCAVCSYYNSFADQIEAAIRGGSISVADAITQLNSVCTQLDSQLQQLSGYSKPEWAPFFHRMSLNALKLFNAEIVYPSIVPANTLSSLTSTTTGKGVLIGGAILLAKLLGVF